MRSRTSTNIGHSWDLEHWPEGVYPHTTARARYLVREHRQSLIAAGCLTRVGRELVIFGEKYARWLERRKVEVPDYALGAARSKPAPEQKAS